MGTCLLATGRRCINRAVRRICTGARNITDHRPSCLLGKERKREPEESNSKTHKGGRGGGGRGAPSYYSLDLLWVCLFGSAALLAAAALSLGLLREEKNALTLFFSSTSGNIKKTKNPFSFFQTKTCTKATEPEIASLFTKWNDKLATYDPDQIVPLYAEKSVLLPTLSNTPRCG